MSIEVPGIARVAPLPGMDPEAFQRIVNQVLWQATKGQREGTTIGRNASDMAASYMATCTKSAPLTPAEIAKLDRDRPADRVVGSYCGPQQLTFVPSNNEDLP